MKLQCPCCDAQFNIEEGFASAEGKQLAALFASLEPSLGKAILYYLRLFNPAKRGLKMAKAIKLVEELVALVKAGTVTRDARTSETKLANIKMWVAGIEQTLEQRDSLTLPLSNHNYLRAIVWGIASDPLQVAALTQFKKKATNSGTNTPEVNFQEQHGRIIADRNLGLISQDEANKRIDALKAGG